MNHSDIKMDVATNEERVFRHFRVSLRISGEEMNFDEISQTLGLAPTHQHRKGEPHGNGVRQQDMWCYQPAIDRNRPLDEHIMALWDSIRSRIAYLRALKQKFQVDIFCGYRSNSSTAGFMVNHRCLGLFSELEVPFGVSVIVS